MTVRKVPPFFGAVCLIGLLVSCSRSEERVDVDRAARPVLSDAVHSGGTAGFYFLPPMVPQPSLEGSNVNGLSPVVRIDEVGGPEIVSYSAGEVRDQGPAHYHTDWRTRDFDLDPNRMYRISVLVAGRVLGFADVELVESGSELRRVDNSQFVPLVDGHRLQIKFFINVCGTVECVASDQCHLPGTCSVAAGGTCTNPVRADGAACSDGNACTLADSCQAGACVGANPVICSASDQCHVAGICDPSTGTCSNPENPGCAPPLAAEDVYVVVQDTTLTIPTATGLLANDVDPNTLALSALLLAPPSHGTLTLAPDGAFMYTPEPGFHSGTTTPDRFTYAATNGTTESPPTLVTILVRPTAVGPVAADDPTYSTQENTPLIITAEDGVLANDFDHDGATLTATLLTTTPNGTLTLEPDGSFTYTPNEGFSGTDTFTYAALDGLTNTLGNPATVQIRVESSNHAPVALADNYQFKLPGCTSPPSNPISHWPAEGDAEDRENQNHATLQGGVTFAPGITGQAFSFDGSTGHVRVPHHTSLDPQTGSFTLEAWIKTTRTTGTQIIAEKYECGGTCISCGSNSLYQLILVNGLPTAAIRAGTGCSPPSPQVQSTRAIADGNYHHLALVRDTATHELKLFVDGLLQDVEPDTTSNITDDDGEPDPLMIGASRTPVSGAPTGFFSGQIDELRYFDRALSAAEVETIYDTAKQYDCRLDTIAKAIRIPGFTHIAGMALSPDKRRLYHVGQTSNLFSLIDTETNTVVETISYPGGTVPLEMALTPDGRKAYVAMDDRLQVIDIENRVAAGSLLFEAGVTQPAFVPDGSRVYVTNRHEHTVVVIDTQPGSPTFHQVLARIRTGVDDNPVGIAITPDGTRAYVANRASSTVTVISTASNTISARIPVTNGSGRSYTQIAITPDGRRAYVVFSTSNRLTVVDTDPASPTFNTEIAHLNTHSTGLADVDIMPDGHYALVTGIESNAALYVVDIRAGSPTLHQIAETLPLDTGGAILARGHPNAYAYLGDRFNLVGPGPAASIYVLGAAGATFDVAAPGLLSNDSDPDGDPLTAELLAPPAHGRLTMSFAGGFQYTSAAGFTGRDSFTYRARDAELGSNEATVEITVLPAASAPSFSSTPPEVAFVGQFYLYAPAATDADGDQLSFDVLEAPDGMIIDPLTGEIEWIPNILQVGEHPVTLTARDGNFTIEQTFTVTVLSNAGNAEITSSPPLYATAGEPYVYPVTAVEPAPCVIGAVHDWRANGDYADAIGNASATPSGGPTFGAGRSGQGFSFDGVNDAISFQTPTGIANFGTSPFTIGFWIFTTSTRFEGLLGKRPVCNHSPMVDLRLSGGGIGIEIDQFGPPSYQSFGALPGHTDGRWHHFAVRREGTNAQFFVDGISIASHDGTQVPNINSSAPMVIGRSTCTGFDGTGWFSGTLDRIILFNRALSTSEIQSLASFPDICVGPFVFALDEGPAGMTIDPATGRLTWTPSESDLGEHPITIRAVSGGGQVILQNYNLQVLGPNVAPQIISTAPTRVQADNIYFYDADAVDEADSVIYSLTTAPPGMLIDRRSGVIFWPTNQTHIGDHPVTVRATDLRGAFDEQSFTVTVEADLEPPRVTLYTSFNVGSIGDTILVQVVATDNVGIAELGLTVDGAPIPLGANQIGVFTASRLGLLPIAGTAIDTSGNIGTAELEFRVFDENDHTPPLIEITSPVYDQVLTYLTDIAGTVSDENLESYSIAYAPAGSEDFVTFHQSSVAVEDGVLGVFDPTLLENDAYTIRVTAQDYSFNISTLQIDVGVAGDAKLGNFHLEFTDLYVPIAGVPITIARIYDTLQAHISGDFGYGWTMALREGRIRETVRVVPGEQDNPFVVRPFRQGTRVYVNNAEGRRVGFTFDPFPTASIFQVVWHPRFRPDPGVFDTLEVEDIPLTLRGDGTFGLFIVGFNYNPREYTVTGRDGTRYRHDQFNGLIDITDRNQNVLEYRANGIFASTGPSITWTRDAEGRITELVDPEGNRITYTYSPEGDLSRVSDQDHNHTNYQYRSDRPHYLDQLIDPYGHPAVRTEYDEQGRLIASTDASGNRATQTFDAANNEELLGDPMGNEYRVAYDDRGNVTAVTNPVGAFTQYAYDADNNVISTTDARGFTTSAIYDSKGNPTAITDALGRTWTMTYSAFNEVELMTDPDGRTTQKIYDGSGNLIELIDAGGFRRYATYDAEGRLTSYSDSTGATTSLTYTAQSGSRPAQLTQPDGTFRTLEYDRMGRLTRLVNERGAETLLTYDAIGHVRSVRDGTGAVTTVQYGSPLPTSITDALGRVSRIQYDANGRATFKIDPADGIEQLIYDGNNQLTSRVDARGRTSQFVYRGDGGVAAMVDALGRETRFDHDLNGNVTAVIDARGHRTEAEYDELDRQVRFRNALGGLISVAYDAYDQVLTYTDESGATMVNEYDDLGRLIQRTGPDGALERWTHDSEDRMTSFTDVNGRRTTYAYDSRGRVSEVVDPSGARTSLAYDGAGNVTEVTDSTGLVRRSTYDAVNRLTSVTDESGATLRLEYDAVGNNTRVIDPLGRITVIEYDELNRPISETNPNGEVIRYAYDEVGNLTSVTDPRGEVTTMSYDDEDQLIGELDPRGFQTTYGYDLVGNVIRRTDRNGRIKEFVYDALGRRIEESWLEGATNVRTISAQYDPTGDITTVSDHDSRYQFQHDAFGRVTSIDNDGTPQLPRMVLSKTYDAAGNLLSTADDRGVRVDRQYDQRDLLIRPSWQGGGISSAAVDIVRDDIGAPIEMRRYDAASGGQLIGRTSFARDAMVRPTSIVHRGAADALISDDQLTYDASGQLTARVRNGSVSTYTHDATGQLLSAVHAGQPNETYVYDASGNRVGAGQVIGTGNLLLEDGAHTYGYDAEGSRVERVNIATGARTTYAYDHRTRLVRVEEREGSGALTREVQFVYDSLNNRIAKIVDGVPARSVFDGEHVWADFDAAGAVTGRYLFGDQTDHILARHRTGEGTAWYLADQVGTIRELTGPSGSPISAATYDSFGNVLAETNAAAGDRFKFTGREYDAETGLYYYRARYFDPAIGQFISEDPYGLRAGDANLRRYVSNNPLRYVDPAGLAQEEYGFLLRLAMVPYQYEGLTCVALSIGTGVVLNGFFTGGAQPPSSMDIALSIVSCALFPPAASFNQSFGASALALRQAAARVTLRGGRAARGAAMARLGAASGGFKFAGVARTPLQLRIHLAKQRRLLQLRNQINPRGIEGFCGWEALAVDAAQSGNRQPANFVRNLLRDGGPRRLRDLRHPSLLEGVHNLDLNGMVLQKYFAQPGTVRQHFKSFKQMEEYLRARPGVRGIVGAQRPGNIGHAFNARNQWGMVDFTDISPGSSGFVDAAGAAAQGFDNFYFVQTAGPVGPFEWLIGRIRNNLR